MHAAHPRYRRIYRFTLTNNDKHVTDERRGGDFIFFQPDRVLDGMDRENPERIPARANEFDFDFDFFLRPIKREKEKKKKNEIYHSFIVDCCCGIYFVVSIFYGGVRHGALCFGSRVHRGRLEMRSRES